MINDETKQKISNANRVNPYVDITPYELGVGFPTVSYLGFHPQPNEVLIYAAPAYTFKDKEQVVGYTGKSAGASVRVAKGLTVRTGGSGGKPIRSDVRKFNNGDLLITNQRVLFVGKDDTFDFKVEKIYTVKLLDTNSFVIQSGRSSKNVGLDTFLVAYAYGLINYVINQYNKGADVYADIMEEQSKITNEQRELCNRVRLECSNVKPPKKKGGIGKVLVLILLVFVVLTAIGILVGVSSSTSDKSNNSGDIVETVSYTDAELLALEGHPVIYDTFEEVNSFYEEVDSDRIKVTKVSDYAAIQRNLKEFTDDELFSNDSGCIAAVFKEIYG